MLLVCSLASCQYINPTDSLKSHIDRTIDQFENDIAFVSSLVPFTALDNQLTLPSTEHPEQIATLTNQLKQLDDHILAIEAYDGTTQSIKQEMLYICRQTQQLTADVSQAIADADEIREDEADYSLLDIIDIPLKKMALNDKETQLNQRTRVLTDKLRQCKFNISAYTQSLARRFRHQVRQVDSPLLFLVTKSDEQALAEYAMARLQESIQNRYQQHHRNDPDAASYAEVFSSKLLTNYTDTSLMANLQTAH
ncbi:hypothetical protein [Spirosoma sp. 48-14]|nr:hypothetical protein [Spirosoma sp. 48-14]OJW74457.1 MAG: hypothetical protein BGO59_20620 [Spirosoma sp. 48-14]